MEWLVAVIIVVVIGLAAALATGAFGELGADPVRDQYRQPLPEAPLTAEDVNELRFGVALRGYSMAQVDQVIDRLAGEIAERDRQLARHTTSYENLFADDSPENDVPENDLPENDVPGDDERVVVPDVELSPIDPKTEGPV